MKKQSLLVLAALFAAATLYAAWQPGLWGGFHTAGAAKYTTPPAYTNVFLDCHAATNYISSSTSHNDWLPIWSKDRCWQYWGQIRLPAGTHTFAGHMDDNSTLVIDGATIFTQSGNAQKSGTFTAAEEGWYDFSFKCGNGSGGAGPWGTSLGVKVNGNTMGFGVKWNGAGTFQWLADPGNRSVFRHDDGRGFANTINFSGEPYAVDAGGVSYETIENLADGQSLTYSVVAGYHALADGVRAKCVGFRLYDVDVETSAETLEQSSDSATSISFTHAAGKMWHLVWLWQVEYRITATPSVGGSVSTADQWVVRGETVSLTATPDSGKSFYRWSGDLPAGVVATSPTISFVADQPRALTASFGGVYYVANIAAAEDADGYGLTPEAPFLTIGYAVAHVPEGSAIHVAPGAYKPTTTIAITTGVQVLGAGRETTSLVGSAIGSSTRMVHVNHPDAVFSGFTISNLNFTVNSTSDSRYGVAAFVQQGVIRDVHVTKCTHNGYSCYGFLANRGGLVENCEVDNCSGSGFYVNQGTAFHHGSGTTRNCYFHHNVGISPKGTVYVGGGTLADCRIEGNRHHDSKENGRQGAGVYIDGGLLTNAVVRCNTNYTAAAGIYMAGGTAANCTIVGNLSLRDENGTHSVSGLWLDNANAKAVNCVLWGNGPAYSPYGQHRVVKGTMTNCLTDADPLFVDAPNGDLHLSLGSPAAGLGAFPAPVAGTGFRCGFSAVPHHVAPGPAAPARR